MNKLSYEQFASGSTLTYYGHMLIKGLKERHYVETEVLPTDRRHAGENLFPTGGSGVFVF
jgi:hypothetical protein